MPPLSCWIIEDEPPAARHLTKVLSELRPEADIAFTTDAIAPALRALETLPHPDLIFSDIHLADGLCFEIWENAPCNCPIIFTTAYDQYGIRAFRVNSIDYLLKPIEATELERALNKLGNLRRPKEPLVDYAAISAIIQRQQFQYRERFLAHYRQELVPLRVDDLRQIFSSDGLTFTLSADGKRYLLDESLDRIAEELDPAKWFRINRAQIVHIEAVRKVLPYFNHRLVLKLSPKGESENVVSRPRVKDCKDWLAGIA